MISSRERNLLRDLARQVADIAALPIQAERRELWKKHNSLQPVRPMILVFPEGSWYELLPQNDLVCESEEMRWIEWMLRMRIYYHQHFPDDTVIEKEWVVDKVIHNSGWGLKVERIPSTTARGAWKFVPVLKEPSDLEKLSFPEIVYDKEATKRKLEQAHSLFGDILDIRLKGVTHISYHLMSQYTDWRGLEEMMLDMYLQPQMLHDTMAFLEEGHRRILQQYVDQNLLSLNNDNTYHSSGGNGYTSELPQPDFDPDHVRSCDMWASAESQELAQVGPKQHAEFALAYERRLLEPFGLTGYGCCEDLTRKLDDVFAISNMRRISISPFADVDACAERLKGDYIFSWKPHPAHLVGDFDAELIRGYIRHTIEVAQEHGCVLEIILKDTHTCEHHPERFDRWTQIAREEVNGGF
ncbi:MAG: hypothetical protein SWK90_13650 [Chloroflexota bacterium]|nr:hypothetical protein [Chloroflexota bacterium]